MVSLKKVLYVVGSITSENDNKYISIRDMCSYFDEYEPNLFNRIRSQLNGHKNLFVVKKVKGIGCRSIWRLNGNGIKYLNKFIDLYDPINDKMLIQPDNDMRIYRPTNKIEVI